MQQMQAATSMAASGGGYPQQNFGAVPSLMHNSLGMAAGVQQPLLPGHFGLFQPPGQPQAPLHPVGMAPEASVPIMPGLQNDQPLILQPPIVPEPPQQEAGQNREWPPGAGQGQDEQDPSRPASPASGVF